MLGPNLFIVYINDIVRSLENSKIQLNADDTLLYLIGQDIAEVINTINQELAETKRPKSQYRKN